MPKKSLEQEIAEFMQFWDGHQMEKFLRDIIPMFEMFDIQDDSEWMNEGGSEEDAINIKMIRAAYIVSKIAENHAGKLARMKIDFKNLWKRLEERVQSEHLEEEGTGTE